MPAIEEPVQSAAPYGYDATSHGLETIRKAARTVVPMLVDLFHPRSVVDFGCGVGDWLAEFHAHGVERILGLDGTWVPTANLQFPASCFRNIDFTSEYGLDDQFDLAVCLEVAEHFTDQHAARLISTLTTCSDLVLFSAAIPGQGGYQHINERFQGDWVSRFAEKGFQAFDLIRPRIWLHPDVAYWYQQNILIFANAAAIERHALKVTPIITSLVHPDLFTFRCDPKTWSLKDIGRHVPFYFRRTMRSMCNKLTRR